MLLKYLHYCTIFYISSGLQVFTYQGGIDSAKSVVNRKSVGETNDELVCIMFCQESKDLACHAIQFTSNRECILLETQSNQDLEKGPDFTIHASGIFETAPAPGKSIPIPTKATTVSHDGQQRRMLFQGRKRSTRLSTRKWLKDSTIQCLTTSIKYLDMHLFT